MASRSGHSESLSEYQHPDLTKTETGCHVWRGSRHGPCWKHGTVGCCLIMHASPAAQRAFDQPRCRFCKRFTGGFDYEDICTTCWADGKG